MPVRANTVDVLGVIAIPAQQAQIRRESEFDDDCIPPTAADTKSVGLPWVVTSGIGAAVALAVVDSQELPHEFATTSALVTVVREHDSFVASAFVSLPFQASRTSLRLATVSDQVRFSFNLARSAETFPAFNPTLSTDTRCAASSQPDVAYSVLFLARLHGAEQDTTQEAPCWK